MKNQRTPFEKVPDLKTKEKPRGNNANSRKSINTVAKPMNMWKNDREHPRPKKQNMQQKKCQSNSAPINKLIQLNTPKADLKNSFIVKASPSRDCSN